MSQTAAGGGGRKGSSLPGRPCFRDAAMHTVAIVPLDVPPGEAAWDGGGEGPHAPHAAGGPTSHSERSLSHLLSSLAGFARAGRASHQRGVSPDGGGARRWTEESSEITLVLPHSQLTRPGDWRYDATPLKSHGWGSGCQRMRLFDGRPGMSRMAHDRLGGGGCDSFDDPWMDLEPHRCTSAVVGILNMKDCRSTADLWRAEESLVRWARRYAHPSDREDVSLGAGDDRSVLTRLFVFDSFDEEIQGRVDLNQTRFRSNQLVAFPPILNDGGGANAQMMALHWNVVVNDLAVALFRSAERKIRDNDAAGKTVWSKGVLGASSGGKAAPSSASITSDETGSVSTAQTSAATPSSAENLSPPGAGMGVGGRLKNAFFDTRKAIVSRQGSEVSSNSRQPSSSSGDAAASSSAERRGPSATRRRHLVTPLDLDSSAADLPSLSARDAEALKRRDLGRREKRSADLSLMAGSPIDAYERYTRAAELTRHSHDPLWYASALEGCAGSFVAMAEAGGHGVDEYLEGNFQLPEEVMALAIAQGVAAGADLGDGRGKTMTVDRTKTTLPQAVSALVEEAMSVLCRHARLAPLHAGLLMKLAEYVQESEEGHLRCRWGEGEYCFGGDVGAEEGSSSDAAVPPRWERTSVSRLDLRGGEVKEMLALDSVERGRRFTELLHRAVSAGGLDDRSRADVAASCARSCLAGTKATRWGDDAVTHTRHRYPRKAALFTQIAAEAMDRCGSSDAAIRSSSLYLAAAHLYSPSGNDEYCEGGEGNDNSATRYGWATLRAAALKGLCSQPADKEAAEAATDLLVALLNEISAGGRGAPLGPMPGDGSSFDYDDYDRGIAPQGETGTQQRSTTAGASGSIRPPSSMTRKAPFFSQAPPSALSLSQSKWLEDDPVPHVQLPYVSLGGGTAVGSADGAQEEDSFAERAAALTAAVTSMKCVSSSITFDDCARAERICMSNIKDIRGRIGASSDREAGTVEICGSGCEGDDGRASHSSLPLPLVVTSAKIVKAEAHLVLERTKALGYSAKFATHSMSTFFNPYAKKQGGKDKSKVQTTLIAEGEERTIMVEFRNHLAVPLEVDSCQLMFDGRGSGKVEAPPLSFTVPAKTSSFAVHFPFIVAVSKSKPEIVPPKSDSGEEETMPEPDMFEPDMFDVTGLLVTSINRTFQIRLKKPEEADEDKADADTGARVIAQLPPSAGTYLRSKHMQPKVDEVQQVVRLESVPAQPNLLVSFAASQSPLDEDASVPVHLSDGEIFTIPPFRLENDFGRSGMGEIERLQVLAVGLPGIPDETLFDTDAQAAALEEEEDVLTESDSDDESFESMMECDGLPPLKMKVIAEGLNLTSINDKSKNKGEGSIVKFQVAATHDMGDQLSNGGNVRIRLRYRGPSPNPATEIWRKREVSLRIIRVKGPRISSLTFRSDLSWGSSYSDLCQSLVAQRRRLDTQRSRESGNCRRKPLGRSHSSSIGSADQSADLDILMEDELEEDDSIIRRVGQDKGVHVCADEVVLLMAVANETSSTIVLSNRKGLVGGFEGSPMPTVRISSGVSVKIPVVIPRIDRFDDEGKVTDIAAELVSRTALQWESEAVEEADGSEKIKRTGRVRIPSRCLREIIDEHKSFASRICKPPVRLDVSVGDDPSKSEITLPLGSAVQVDASVTIQDWVPPEVLARCRVTLEFCCAEKQRKSSSSSPDRLPYFWCGQLRRTVSLTDDSDDKSHLARIAFFQSGIYVVSAVAKISSEETPGIEESWWAPHARVVNVVE